MLNHLHQTDINTSTPQHPNTFFSCDWGTSSFRLTLAALPSLEVLGGVSNSHGVSETFRGWKESGGDESLRADFFLAVIRDAIAAIEHKLGMSLAGVPIIASGMVSSSIGMRQLPYGELPLALDGSNLAVGWVSASEVFPHEVLLVSGVKTTDDVMRGEETQLIGSVMDKMPDGVEHLHLFPGTHSKHVRVVDGKAVSFRTYMTGEFFELLSTKSILSDSVAQGDGLQTGDNLSRFNAGVEEGSGNSLLNSAFHVRTRALSGQHTREMNYYYLSGLLIGAELGHLSGESGTPIVITGNGSIIEYYDQALRFLGITNVTSVDGGKAVLAGQSRIFQRKFPTS